MPFAFFNGSLATRQSLEDSVNALIAEVLFKGMSKYREGANTTHTVQGHSRLLEHIA